MTANEMEIATADKKQVIGDDELFRFKIFWDTDNVPDIEKVLNQFDTGDLSHYMCTDYFKIRIVGEIKYNEYSDMELCCMPMLGWDV